MSAEPRLIEHPHDRPGRAAAERVDRSDPVEWHGPDSYLDDTLFLTHRGWRTYDEIMDGEPVGTVDRATGGVEFQLPTGRMSRPYSGPVHIFRHRYTACAVTPGHRMWTSPVNRGPCGRIGNSYRTEVAAWAFRPARQLTKLHHVRVVGTPRDVEHPVSDGTLALVGAYVSEGHVAKRLSNGAASVLGFSQKLGGRLEPVLAQVGRDHELRKYSYTRHDGGRRRPCDYAVYTLADRAVAAAVVEECGSGSAEKKLPGWAFDLSARQAEVLLAALMAGDGTRCRSGWQVYYTISTRLAGDVQALAVVAGRRSVVWGPYQNGIYQVMVQEPGREHEALTIRGNLRVEEVVDRRVVCFTVPNETLVTRREGRVAMHGSMSSGVVSAVTCAEVTDRF